MNEELIDANILVIAEGMGRGISESDIIEAYIKAGFEMSDITLLLAAAKIIYEDRKNAPPPQAPVFRRVT